MRWSRRRVPADGHIFSRTDGICAWQLPEQGEHKARTRRSMADTAPRPSSGGGIRHRRALAQAEGAWKEFRPRGLAPI